VTDLEALTADQLRGLFARTRDTTTRRAIQRRLQQLDTEPPPPAPPKAPPMHEADFLRLFRRRLPPTTCAWSLADITETLDRAAVEWNERKKRG
jgi:hypothetical protein